MTPSDNPLDEQTGKGSPPEPGRVDDPPPEIPWALPVEQPASEALSYAETIDEPEAPAALPAPKPPRPGFWEAVLWCLAFVVVTNGTVAAVLAAGVAIHLTVAPDGKALLKKIQNQEDLPASDLKWEWAAAFLTCETISVIFAWFIVRIIVGRDWRRRLALRRPSASHFALGVLAFPALLYGANIVHELVGRILPSIQYNKQLTDIFGEWPWWFGVMVIGLGPALSEELFCRGFLGRGLIGRYGPLWGILLTSLFFGILHVDPPHVAATFVMGLGLHFTYLMTRSLWIPIMLHFLNNSAAVLAAAASVPEEGAGAVQNPLFPLAILALWAALGWAFYRSRVRFVQWQPDYPGVEYPPAGSAYRVVRPWPGWLPSLAVVLALSAFVTVVYYTRPVTPPDEPSPVTGRGSCESVCSR
jgi:membrane protease YdiL (CAAX protease family)